MKKSLLATETGDYWHYNPIGTGIVFTYHTRAKQVLITCEHSGQLIETKNFYRQGGYENKEQFAEAAREIYLEMIEDGTTLNIDYMEDPTIVGNIGVDFKLLKN